MPWHPNESFYCNDIKSVIGQEMYNYFKEALQMLLEWQPELNHPKVAVLLPAIEGTGQYPVLDENLKV